MQYSTVPYIDGISPLFNIECLNKIGGLDYEGNIYGYGVDVWNSLALHRAGFPVVVDHQVTIRHIYHSTAKKVEGFLATAAEAQHKYLAVRLGRIMKRYLNRNWLPAVTFGLFKFSL